MNKTSAREAYQSTVVQKARRIQGLTKVGNIDYVRYGRQLRLPKKKNPTKAVCEYGKTTF